MSEQKQSDPLEFWLDSLGSDSTKELYGQYMAEFLDFAGLSSIEVLKFRQDDLVSSDLLRRKRFEGLLRQFLRGLDERKAKFRNRTVSVSFKRSAYAAIRSFFGFYDVGLNMRREDAPKGEYNAEVRAFRKDELAVLVEVADVMEKALVLFMKDSGIARADMVRLALSQVGEEIRDRADWRLWLTPENCPLSVNGIRQKTSVPFRTFIGEEAVEALRLYFEAREIGTQMFDRRKRGIPPEKIGLSNFVFRCKKSLRRMRAKNVTLFISKLITKTDIHCLPGEKVGAHSFRHFFQTTLENPELSIPSKVIRQMMGHKVSRADRTNETNPAYSHHGGDVRRQCYIKAYPFLSVKARRIDAERLKSLEDYREKSEKEKEKVEGTLGYYQERVKRLEDIVDVLLKGRK